MKNNHCFNPNRNWEAVVCSVFLPRFKGLGLIVLFAISPANRHLAWRTENYDQFSFTLD